MRMIAAVDISIEANVSESAPRLVFYESRLGRRITEDG